MVKLKKYAIYGAVIGTKYIGTVMAEDKVEAEELGWKINNLNISLCDECSGEVSGLGVQNLIIKEEID